MSSLSLLLFFHLITLTLHARVFADTNSSKCPSAPFTPRIVATKEEAQLKVLVPNITKGSLRQFVDCSDPSHVRGFCIDVFQTALSILVPAANLSSTPSIHYTCFNFSLISPNTTDTLTYDDMIGGVANGSYDAVVGDVTIGALREFEVEFTHKYMESGVVIIGKVIVDDAASEWTFFVTPFTWRMWCMVMGAFAFTGFILWIIEHKYHLEFTQGSFAKRINKIFWFIIEALILLERELIKSSTAQLVMVAWVFVVLLFSASYTAGLSSIITASNLSPTTYDIVTLKASNATIGYRRGSIVKDYYLLKRFHIQNLQLKPIRLTRDFVSNIIHGDVISIIDELPYANIILQNLSCKFDISGHPLTSEGFGFGFNRSLKWADKFSIALMNLTESGCLQELQDNHTMSGNTRNCSSNSQSQKVSWKSSLTLSFPLILISYLCVIISWIRRFRQQRLQFSANQRPVMVIIDDPSILQAQMETTCRLKHQDLELSTLPQS